MRKIGVILLFIMFSFQLVAGDGKSFISLRSGVSIPIGDYGSKDLSVGSFTTTGVSFSAEGAWYALNNVGFGASIAYNINPVDAVGLATEVVHNDPFMEDLTVRSDPFTMINVMGGAYYYFNIKDRVSIEPSLLAGVMFGKTPFQLYEPTFFMIGSEYYKVTSSRDYGFAVKPGFRVNYNVSNCISLGLYSEFVYSQLSFGFYTSKGLEYRDRKISYVDMGLNLTIKL